MSTIFESPCPGCGRALSVADGDQLTCSSCQRSYRSRMGHLFPVAEARTTTMAAPARQRATAGQS
jgi:hypothetical protein